MPGVPWVNECAFKLAGVTIVCWQPFFFSKGHQGECLVIANEKGQYGGGRVGKKAGQGRYGRVGKKAR